MSFWLIRGYDPMNMYRLDDYCLLLEFWDGKAEITFNKPVLLQMKHNSPDEVAGYFTD